MRDPSKKLSKEQLRWIRQTSSLTFRELEIMMQRFVFNKTLPELADHYKVQTERVRQLEHNALKKLTVHI